MLTEHHFRRLERVERTARTMDRAFRIPFTGIRMGWDSLLGLVPGVGDTLALLPAAWILKESHALGAPGTVLGKMAGNLAVDWVIGLVPLIGDVFDIGFRANVRNAALLRGWMETQGRVPQDGPRAPRDLAA
ncbi:DUF4112 domain-containing protein [Salipiger sp.]|uniref:DUF4112 domain-containing protein n=1 Tax=Salipiger sp. TaxID=2078585 RepID=UPI003A96E488